MLERRVISAARPIRTGLRAWYSSEAGDASSSSSAGSSSSSLSSQSYSDPGPSERAQRPPAPSRSDAEPSRPLPGSDLPPEAANLDQLWRNALSAPASALKKAPRTSAKARSLLASATPAPRTFKGTLQRTRRAEGQTPHEAGQFNKTLGNILADLVNKQWKVDGDTFAAPGAARGKSLAHLTSAPAGWGRSPRVEEDDAELTAALDTLKEELSGVQTPGEAVVWAQANVFARTHEMREGGETPRPQWPRTYPKALAELIKTLWERMNAPHLALAMFEHARTLSVESYLDGCQTSAYNQLIRVHWDAFRDLNAVLAAVQEMKVNGVGWDRYTSGYVGGIVEAAGKELLDARSRSATHRWGSEAYITLSKLEERWLEDQKREESKYERRISIKRRARQSAAAAW
ncbi:hypothetical protein CC85DRAFT_331233 [Cutaneotrichosporon oleaginosum]|uniref:Mtf2-like C-terminal domain-containing protein n=1 Tax=Cutaneotrichosporon oleaginosum TaxID=879819 RepID=A0A0J1AU90_9TREE|nr:uncharacterized protein CC85DRAFT_331233 [Cutaneotrichosporon oleaginosum]KLT38869.1 hypothetical protein CC85DRAFT_331233 [Cutaneotrichosporon oleaginosum]TXT14289.1 hypothetical protein COLE_00482 [Cutaneotrichosporon oleaginosum]